MLNMKIGEIRAFRCVEVKDEDNCCVGCMFNDESCCWVDVEIFGHCEKAYREDGKNVIFVRTDPNEIIRERIERQIDRFNDMFTLLEVLPEPKEELDDARDAVQD